MNARVLSQVLPLVVLAVGNTACGAHMPPAINNDKDLQMALKAAKTPEDHTRIAAYYQVKADALEAQAAEYEKASAANWDGPVVKNLMGPNPAARYEQIAKRLRGQAQFNRERAAGQQLMAGKAPPATP